MHFLSFRSKGLPTCQFTRIALSPTKQKYDVLQSTIGLTLNLKNYEAIHKVIGRQQARSGSKQCRRKCG
jgi:hypothetical protein